MLSPAAVLLFIPVESVLAAGSPPVVDAGPNKVLAFPAKDLTLFGHATDPENDPLTVTWKMTSGPASVKFSAPWGLATTVTFTTPGTYTFQLVVSDATSNVTSSVTVTVNPASAQTAFYVDPTYTGSTQNGSAANPWKSGQAIDWTVINNALASNSVIIYFSARLAGSDVSETVANPVAVRRTNTSTNRLTLDGMSKYNTNDASPNWVDYMGKNKFKITSGVGESLSLGWNGTYKQNYITLRGFESTGGESRVVWGGTDTTLEYLWIHDISGTGPTLLHGGAVMDYPDCSDVGRSQRITVRNVQIERGVGEGIYIAGNYLLQVYGGCPAYGNTHSDILIEGNTIIDPGINGAQGDGLDLKAGLQNMTIRNNVIQNTHTGAGDDGGWGVTWEGTFNNAPMNYVLEGNRIYRTAGHGMFINNNHGSIIRNNVVANSGVMGITGGGIVLSGDTTFTTNNAQIYNNTVYGNMSGIDLGYITGPVSVRNNLVVGNGQGGSASLMTGGSVSSDYNLWAPSKADYAEGTHSLIQTSTTGIVVAPATGDFHLVSASPAINKGVDLSPTGFAIDLDGTSRPQGAPWDIGAYEFSSIQGYPRKAGQLGVGQVR